MLLGIAMISSLLVLLLGMSYTKETLRRKRMPILNYAQVFYHWHIKGSQTVPYAPEEVSLEVTNICNFRCEFCPQSLPTHHDIVPRTTIVPEDARLILRKLRDGGVTTKTIHYTLDGEPFSNRRFNEICSVGKDLGFTSALFATNGYFCTNNRLRELPDGVKYTLTIDFCSDSKYFETYRGTPNSWRIVLANILAAESFPDVSFLVTDISSYKVRDPKELSDKFSALHELLGKQPRMQLRQKIFHNATGLITIGQKPASKKYHRCPYPWSSLIIASNGDVVACCRDLEHRTVLGNLFTQSLADVWNGKPMREMRAAIVNKIPETISACAGCDLPYDGSKFSARNLIKTATGRLNMFGKR